MSPTFILVPILALACSTASADVSISNKPTQNMSCDGGVCTAMARNANLNDVDLMQMLSSSDVTVKTGGGAKNIQVRYGFAWSSSHQVTLDSGGFVEFREPVTVMNSGGLAIKTNRRQGGELLFSGKGSVDLWDLHSKFTINGVRYTLVNDIATLAAGIAANPSGAFALAKDYDAAADGIYQKPPIATKFTGSFEGLSHLIDHLTINGQMKFGVARSGLFAWIYRNGDIAGSVRDLNLRHAKVSSKARKVEIGILAGENDGSIAHVLVSGRVTALGEHAEAGGMVGSNGYQAIIQSSSAVGIDVSADNYHGRAGGIAGLNWSQADIYRSVATGTASGHLVGGLVGENSGVGAISQSYADVAIPSVDNGLAGGLVALNNFAITDCYSLGAVSGHVAAGFDAKNTKFGYIRTSYSTGLVTGSQAPGGFVSDEEASDNALAADYWNLDTSGIADPSRGCGNIPNCPGVTGLTDAQLKSGLPDGFDPNIWGQSPNINNGYPYLLANPPQ